MRLLVVEDDVRVGAALTAILRHHRFEVTLAHTAQAALDGLTPEHDVVLLDLGLPDIDGFEVCNLIRRTSSVPIIVVTARAQARARIHGLNLGADDYLVKPYNPGELIARIHAVARRAHHKDVPAPRDGAPAGVFTAKVLRVDPFTRQVHVNGSPVTLTRKEFDLLTLLVREPGIVFRREQIISEVWNTTSTGAGRTLEVHIASLRSKLGTSVVIETVRGLGYRLAAA
jgi:DNA-binding response OmpR family regulator